MPTQLVPSVRSIAPLGFLEWLAAEQLPVSLVYHDMATCHGSELTTNAILTSVDQSRVAFGCWCADYNDAQLHSRLGRKTPSEFAFACHQRRDLTPRYAESSTTAPTVQSGKSNRQSKPRIG